MEEDMHGKAMEEIMRGCESTHQLKQLLLLNNHELTKTKTTSIFVEHVVNNILNSFNNVLFLLDKDKHNKIVQKDHFSSIAPIIRSVDLEQSCNLMNTSTAVRGSYYKRRNTTQTWEEVTKIPIDDDGHRWRKYGQKKINNSQYSRNYYRCTHKYDQRCLATKQVHRIQQKPPLYKTTYYGHHTCGKYLSNPNIILDPNSDPINSSIFLSFNNTFPNPTKQECPFLSSSLISTSPSLSSSPNSLEYKEDVPSSSLDDNLLSHDPTLDNSISTRHVSTISSTLDEFDHKDMMYGFSNDFVEFNDDFFHF
ncbi:WRKY DNA-binding transcription factor [Trifolium repens]|nr:WRKY DNA-binding transcription factor [Trifolium repens]